MEFFDDIVGLMGEEKQKTILESRIWIDLFVQFSVVRVDLFAVSAVWAMGGGE